MKETTAPKVLFIAPVPPAAKIQAFLIATLMRCGDWQKMSEQEREDLLKRGIIYDTEPGRAIARSFDIANKVMEGIRPGGLRGHN